MSNRFMSLSSVALITLLGLSAAFADVPATQPAKTKAAFQYAGHVVDEYGKPIEHVKVIVTHRNADDSQYGYIAETTTDANGDFLIDRAKAQSGADPVMVAFLEDSIRIDFVHPDHLYGRLEDLSLLDTEAATHLKVALHRGRPVVGTLHDDSGQPVVGAVVEITFGKLYDFRRATVTDAKGHFRLNGLPLMNGTINVLATKPGHDPLTAQALAPTKSSNIGTLLAKPIDLPAGTVVYQLLGMKLVDVDPQLSEAFHLARDDGVMVLDPGTGSDRLNIGSLKTADTFRIVGNDNVKNFSQFRSHLLNQHKLNGATEIRVVYNFKRVDFSGSNTQYMKLSDDDLAELAAVPEK